MVMNLSGRIKLQTTVVDIQNMNNLSFKIFVIANACYKFRDIASDCSKFDDIKTASEQLFNG